MGEDSASHIRARPLPLLPGHPRGGVTEVELLIYPTDRVPALAPPDTAQHRIRAGEFRDVCFYIGDRFFVPHRHHGPGAVWTRNGLPDETVEFIGRGGFGGGLCYRFQPPPIRDPYDYVGTIPGLGGSWVFRLDVAS
jgi:hypothetical protein